ncbi:hypothetical protein A5692_01965 [Mycobacterium sp. E342]|uniref:PhzF family phenazine biosynthesis protein n=1 Tax=Mycobacterium sp. E342 TaxID=1834147 RepID=UPI0007FCBCD5|nr:PhzF family phenazine biosynthesis protein [Mycobacterium sp. E342]OBH29215.1 hypothetical protein A5692_01965 [Mycobacterium sp. E342]
MRFFQVDCFADRPFTGNPNAVVLLNSQWPATEWLQRLAAEVNLPATAFVRQAQPHRGLRWFSPHTELTLCGSGTLAAAHILWELGECHEALRFATCAGLLEARLQPDHRITLNLPSDDPTPVPVGPELVDALGVRPQAAARGRLDLLAELDSADAVRCVNPNLESLAMLDARGLIVTAPGEADIDFVSRFFAPAAGIDEDPVTASAHCTLGAYWSAKLNKTVLTGHQVSARGGYIDVHLNGGRVDLTGGAITITREELTV